MTETRISFQDLIERIHNVPSLPEVVTRVVRLVNDPRSDAERVGKIMTSDSAMVAKILRLVNSSYFALPEPVHDLDQAIVILGFKTVRSVALSISVLNLFQQESAGFNMRSFWLHGCVCASICRLVAERQGSVDPDLAFIAGLLKDIGLVLMAEYAPDETRSTLAVARELRYNLARAAHKVMNTDHTEISAWLCRKWELEPILIEAIANQNFLEGAHSLELVSILQFAEYLCALKRLRIAGDCGEPSLDQDVWKHLGFDKTKLVDILADINDEVDRARELLNAAT